MFALTHGRNRLRELLGFSNPTSEAYTYPKRMVSLAIEELPAVIKADVEEFLERHPRSPAARLRPRMGMVGDIWLAFIGPEVRRGASGLGNTPRNALRDFNRHFLEPLVSRNGSEPTES
jgi:hypothetical protein